MQSFHVSVPVLNQPEIFAVKFTQGQGSISGSRRAEITPMENRADVGSSAEVGESSPGSISTGPAERRKERGRKGEDGVAATGCEKRARRGRDRQGKLRETYTHTYSCVQTGVRRGSVGKG